MTTAWHYTTVEKFLLIVKDGEIRPAAIGVTPPERPIVWFSLAQSFEMTARKGIVDESGSIRAASISEMRELGGGLVRFGLDAVRLIPWKGGQLRKAAGMSYAMAKKLEVAGMKQGANPFEWLGSLEPVPIEECVIKIMDESYKNGQWVDVDESVEWLKFSAGGSCGRNSDGGAA